MARLAAVSLALALGAQTASAPEFAVVSVRPTEPGSRGGPGPFVQTTPGRFVARGTLSFYIQYAYGLQAFQIAGGPDWVTASRYDINATQPADATDFALMPRMLQAALADRFQLVTRPTTRDMDGFALVATPAPRLRPSAAGDVEGAKGGSGRLDSTRATLAQLASFLARATARPVADRTGLTGTYNVTLTWTPDPLDPNGVSIFTAVQEQLGLKLEPARVPADVLLIERVQQPAAN